MENQHRHIAGYRELSADEIALMNEIKALERKVKRCVQRLREKVNDPPDQRWVSIGATHMDEGFMALTRSIARPQNEPTNED